MTDTCNSKDAGQQAHQEWSDRQKAGPEFRRICDEAATKKEVWRQLVEARQAAGLTQEQLAQRLGISQSQVAKIERRGYEAYTLTTLRRYVQALGTDFTLEVQVRHAPRLEHVGEPIGTP
jgi:ribosome-binding protein aMBF1 (putative translation factor)